MFYGYENSIHINIKTKYENIKNPLDLYNVLSNIWCKETCALRLQKQWSTDNITLGQCSITSILFQDLFGGEIYGILLENGNYHCFNKLNEYYFDLTSEQFGSKQLNYSKMVLQDRNYHLSFEEKNKRYHLLLEKLENY